MDLVAGAMGNLGPKLLQLLQDEYKLQKGVKEEIRSLSLELQSVHALLLKVAQVPWDQIDEQVKVWAREVRETSYDMEDVIDTFLVRIEGCEPADPSRLKRFINKMGNLFSDRKVRHDIAGAVEDIKKKLQEVAERRARYKVDEALAKPAATTSTIDPRLAAMYKEVTQLIGIDKSMGEVISLLTSPSQEDDVNYNKIMKVVSIVGVGGLGKTTLAKASYDKLKSQYDCKAFISVGQNPDFVKVFKDILFGLDKIKYDNIHNAGRGADLLIRELQEFLENKRYFLVIDDIWEPQSWEAIKLGLVENNCGSAIITTTRKFEVAIEAGEVYKLQPLSYDNSNELFYTRVFGVHGKCLDNEMDELSNKILQKCDGVPLAIITMASLLAGKPREEWSEVCNSIGFGHKDSRHVENTMRILSFSYYDMPPHLRTCLLYISVFPEDHFIKKDCLIRMWVAEGFIHENRGARSLFEIGEGYFNELINRSMIQGEESKTRMYGSIIGCRVHDMILDLIRSLSSEENFVTIASNAEGTLDTSESKLSQRSIRRLAHQDKTSLEKANHTGMTALRSLFAINCGDYYKGVSLLSFKLLRVLALENCAGTNLEHLGSLFHLRYLSLRDTRIYEFPKEVGALKFLQTIDLRGCGLIRLPSTLGHLTQLVCLIVDLAEEWPEWIWKLTSLEELHVWAPGHVVRFASKLGRLREHRVFKVATNTYHYSDTDVFESLHNLQKIQHLKFDAMAIDVDTAKWEAGGSVLSRHLRVLSLPFFKFSTLPSCINPSRLPYITTLKLNLEALDEQDVECLGRLPELLDLGLNCSTVTVSNIAGNGYFQKLRSFRMGNSMLQFLPSKEEGSRVSLHIWNEDDAIPFGFEKTDECRVAPTVMPSLEQLEMCILMDLKDGNCGCDSLGLKCLPSLQTVRFHRCYIGRVCCGGHAEEHNSSRPSQHSHR